MSDGRILLQRWAALLAAILMLTVGALVGSVATAKTGRAPFSSDVRVPVMVASASPVRAEDVTVATGFSPVVEKVRPVVVNISSTKVVRPQGGPVSPLRSNLYLHWFDKLFHRADGPAPWAGARLVRYADDFVVLARHQGTRLTGWMESKLEGWLGLGDPPERSRSESGLSGIYVPLPRG